MPGHEFPDDDAVEAILGGRPPRRDSHDPLVEFARDVRAVADRPLPRPSVELATVLMAGFSTEKGDRLATAGSNVPGPAPQAAGLPKWRKERTMVPTFLSGVIAKVTAGACAGLIGMTAAGAAGALPGPAQDAVANVVEMVTPFELPAGGSDGGTSFGVAVSVEPSSGGGISVDTGTTGGSTASASADASVSTAAGGGGGPVGGALTDVPLPDLGDLPLPGTGDLGGLPGLDGLPIPTCVTDIVDVDTGQPKVPLSEIAPQVIACARTLIASAGVDLPVGVEECVNSILSLAGTVATNPGAVPDVAGFDFTGCAPVDVSACMSSVMGLMQNLPFGALGSFGGTGGIPNLSGFDFSGCLPFDLDACLSSIFDMAGDLPGLGLDGIPGMGSGAVPDVGSLDLSACVPFGSLGSIPGMPNLSGFLPFSPGFRAHPQRGTSGPAAPAAGPDLFGRSLSPAWA